VDGNDRGSAPGGADAGEVRTSRAAGDGDPTRPDGPQVPPDASRGSAAPSGGASEATERADTAAPDEPSSAPAPAPVGDRAAAARPAEGGDAPAPARPAEATSRDGAARDLTAPTEDRRPGTEGPRPGGDDVTTREGAAPARPARTEHPKIFDLPDEPRRRPNGTLVLGGAAAAEGRTTGPNPRIAGAAPPEATGDGDGGDGEGRHRGRHFARGGGPTRPRWVVALAALPAAALLLLIGAWAVDTAALSGQVLRNVEVAGRSVGGLGEASLPDVMEEVDAELARRPVVITSGGTTYETTAGELGLRVDAEATAEAALDVGRDDALVLRPFRWLASFFDPREVEVEYVVTESQVNAKLFELQAGDLVGPKDPGFELTEEGWRVVPGVPGEGIDAEQVAAALPEAAAEGGSDPIRIEAERVAIAPRFSDEEAQQLVDQVNAMAANGLEITARDTTRSIDAATLRTWVVPHIEGSELQPRLDAEVVNQQLPEVFADIEVEPQDARFEVQGGTPVVIPAQEGVACCAEDSADRIWEALSSGATEVEIDVVTTEPELTTEEAENLGIREPVGGNHAWRDGQPTTAGPGFTTYYAPGQPRVTNIHRIADMVRGVVILPGETFSVNEHVGPRTIEKGFVPAGAIRDGEHVDEVGGGVSQFATTLFNAAYFAGLDIPVSQAHSEYFPRYPLGREATMGHPAPDLQIRNNTPYGVLIWTSYTDTSITVTLYSTPYARAEQTGISESMSGACRVVTTTRTRTYPDGSTETDTFRATYRPGPGQGC